ncbi:Oidioi.mRNA.OKI2018_I69.PAR.g11032.t1.cds [Oikopleura dioica]|uniref:Oidioi.mRNA.OKI2018_I69.PAR.g11032.t1.cds n=1 Tax=Oikopleura dioica TaxID=34765 RepID=A0ABN7RZY9_OIKDI|nr:Oidioi.mRNA.OKI2018_I69.PAR.g11032.t1.cds [Oikopleura dioica]
MENFVFKKRASQEDGDVTCERSFSGRKIIFGDSNLCGIKQEIFNSYFSLRYVNEAEDVPDTVIYCILQSDLLDPTGTTPEMMADIQQWIKQNDLEMLILLMSDVANLRGGPRTPWKKIESQDKGY